MSTVKPINKLTFRDRLSRLTFENACRLLGEEGKKLISRGGTKWDIHLAEDVFLKGDLMRVTLRSGDEIEAIPTLTMTADANQRLQFNCDRCDVPCEHVGAIFSLILEHKTDLGLAAAPPEREPIESLTDEQLIERAINERRERAKLERMKIKSSDPKTPWTSYAITSLVSGKSYRVVFRGFERGGSFCSCPDFRTNTLGTCKHILKVAALVKRKFTPRQRRKPYRQRQIEVVLRYTGEITLQMLVPEKVSPEVETVVKPFLNQPITGISQLLKQLQKLEALDVSYSIFPDAEEYIQQQLHQNHLSELVAEIRKQPDTHPLRQSLLKVPLLPYQLDGVAFAAGAGRTVLADDMGLGKTIQAVGVAELLAQQSDISKVLVICPASVKSQWRSEIRRFSTREVQIVYGGMKERKSQYINSAFFTICNYEQVLKDILAIEQTPWDLIILDEGQRIKNWEAKTSRVIKGLKSKFALVLTGTPLENRLDELYSVVQFIDDRRLGPGFRFFNTHRIIDEKGKTLGYKNLDQLREALRPVLLRRTRDTVKLELPERTTEIVRIAPTDEQLSLHNTHMKLVAQIVRKPYLTEMDVLRLRQALLMARMSADGTYLVTKEVPNWSSKLERLADIFDDIANEPSRKVILFSEWTTMLDLIEPLLQARGLAFVRLDGSVPQKKRQELVFEFQNSPKCRFFLSTNAGSTGLNLQAANTVINVDLPWNPAILEQRIGRAHRMGQRQEVQVLVLVTEGTIEESLLSTLSAKRDLALAALDASSDVDEVNMLSGSEDLKAKLEILLGARPEANLDMTAELERDQQLKEETAAKRKKLATAGGELLGAAIKFLGEVVSTGNNAPPPDERVVNQLQERLAACVDDDPSGQPRLSITLPNRDLLNDLAQSLAKLLASAGSGKS